MLQNPVISLSLVTATLQFNSSEINAQDENGNTPLMVLLERLFESDFDEKSRYNAFQRVPPPGETKEDEPISVTEQFSPYLKLKPIVDFLINYPGANLGIQNNLGDTALHIVCRHYHIGALEARQCNFNSFEQAEKFCLIAFKLLDCKF